MQGWLHASLHLCSHRSSTHSAVLYFIRSAMTCLEVIDVDAVVRASGGEERARRRQTLHRALQAEGRIASHGYLL